jgi:hypothetical protein
MDSIDAVDLFVCAHNSTAADIIRGSAGGGINLLDSGGQL